MSGEINFTIDGVQVQGQAGQSILQAAALSNIYIPHLCADAGSVPGEAAVCALCWSTAGPRPRAFSPSQRASWSRTTPRICAGMRRELVEMLFVEGNHFCPFCEKRAIASCKPWLSPGHAGAAVPVFLPGA